MNKLWISYMDHIIGHITNPEQILSKLSKADIQGATLKIVDSLNESMKGIEGIIVYECSHVFYIVTPKNAFKCAYSVFLPILYLCFSRHR
jgi:hypothetical protein